MPNFYKQLCFGALYDFRDFQKGIFRTIVSSEKRIIGALLSSGTRPGSDFAFPESIVITVPFGPSVFVKRSSFGWRWAHFLFVLLFFVLCFK